MTAAQYFQSGDLQHAVSAATEAVKAKPGDVPARSLLCEMLCFNGDLSRVDLQLDALGEQDAALLPGVSLFRRLIRAESARQQFFAEGRLPSLLGQPSGEMRLRLEASIRIREGHPAEAAALLDQAESLRRHLRGTCDGQPFDDFRDLDDLTASILEVLTSMGDYYWVPLDQVESIELHPGARPRDFMWRAAHISARGGPDGEVYIPVLYPTSHQHPADSVRLGLMTDWQGAQGEPVRGIGRRTFLVGDVPRSIAEISRVEFAPAE